MDTIDVSSTVTENIICAAYFTVLPFFNDSFDLSDEEEADNMPGPDGKATFAELLVESNDCYESITRCYDHFKADEQKTLAKARVAQNYINRNWASLCKLHSRLREAASEEDRQNTYFTDQQHATREASYLEILAALFEHTDLKQPSTSTPNDTFQFPTTFSAANFSSHFTSNLPVIKVPPFNGDFEKWDFFRDYFKSLIIDDTRLDDLKRLHYLRASLSGDALAIIEHIKLQADHFKVAWDALSDKYENTGIAIEQLLKSFFALPNITKESASELRELHSKITSIIGSLKAKNEPTEQWSSILVYFITQKLDPSTRKAWSLSWSTKKEYPKYDDLIKFILNRANGLSSFSPTSSNAGSNQNTNKQQNQPNQNPNKQKPKQNNQSNQQYAFAVTTQVRKCVFCSEEHSSYSCPQFKALTVPQRFELAKSKSLCFNCLGTHKFNDCKSKNTCYTCHGKHHTMLHKSREGSEQLATPKEPKSTQNQTQFPSSSVNSSSTVPNKVDTLLITNQPSEPSSMCNIILATATVLVHAENGRTVKARALIDPASTWTLVSESIADRLNARKIKMSTDVSGVGGCSAGRITHAAALAISPRTSTQPFLHTQAIVMKKLTRYIPTANSSLTQWPHLKGLPLADENPLSDEPINLIIGADLYGLIILDGLKKGNPDQPIAQNTVFGWILSGWTDSNSQTPPPNAIINCIFTLNVTAEPEEQLDYLFGQFFRQEELPHDHEITNEDTRCENHFVATHSRQSDGRYVVRLPFKLESPLIGKTRDIAHFRFFSLEKRLIKNPQMYSDYRAFMQDYEKQGHMTKVAPPQDKNSTKLSYFPHHGVFKDSTTTKLRVVYNASCLTSNGTSLNDHLYAGPKLQADLGSVLLQWRQYRYVFSADIAQMYRQIIVHPDDRDYQRIFWRSSPNEPLNEYQLNTVTFGVASAPFLALRVLKQLSIDEGDKFPAAKLVLEQGLYVDDTLFGAHSLLDADKAREELVQLLALGGFVPRKWASNCPELLINVNPADHGLAVEKPLRENEGIKLLGVSWNPASDSFHFHLNPVDIPVPTKRSLLSAIARIFDPLGWIAPAIVEAKMILQSLWLLKIDWDSPLPPEIVKRWNKFYTALPHLSEVKIPRWIHMSPQSLKCELHAFCDASRNAYAAIVYIRIQDENDKVHTSLLICKTKVAPLKMPKSCSTPELTIPRLELLGAYLLIKTMKYLRSLPVFADMPFTCWTDSTIVLSWLRRLPPKTPPFVVNRVQNILEYSSADQWRHVSTGDNPADLASRGVTADKLPNNLLYFCGPPWLQLPPDQWPTFYNALDVLSHACFATQNDTLETLAERVSSWSRILRITAYALRWLKIHRHNKTPVPTAEETTNASRVWYRWLQSLSFPDEIACLQNNKPLAKNSPLASLSPFLDEYALLRVGGRLRNANLPYDARHPIILRSHPVVRLIVRQAHEQRLHGNPSLVLSTLRSTVWILQAKKIIRSVIFHCVICARLKAEVATQLMAHLPAPRVNIPVRAFEHTGVDYAGPIKVRYHTGRWFQTHSAYIAVFVCFSVKAIHLELVSNYTSQAFIAAFKRFVSRRGFPSQMYSDRGTTFTGANNELQKIFNKATKDSDLAVLLADSNIKWSFLPPAAPHFGGLWEAGVKSVKFHLRRVLRDKTPTVEELTTLLCEVEACLNSRPLAPLTESADDLDVLTPGHFLIGSALTAVPSPSMLDMSVNSLSRWQLCRQWLESFWQSYSADYVRSMQHRTIWQNPQENIAPGQLVLLNLPNYPPTKWPLGLVTQCYPDSEGLVRVVQVRTATSVYERPIDKIALLPVTDLITPHLC